MEQCNGCSYYEKIKKEALRKYNSAFDAVFEVQSLVKECSKTCEKEEKKYYEVP